MPLMKLPVSVLDVDSGPSVLTGHAELLDGLGSEPIEDYEGEESRYAIYSVRLPYVYEAAFSTSTRRRVCETSLDGIGGALRLMREEGEIGHDSRIGIFDRRDREWLVNPWAKGGDPE